MWYRSKGPRRRTRGAVMVVAVLLVVPLLAAAENGGDEVPGGTIVFPSDNRFTVPDGDQLTGRRVNLPAPNCNVFVSRCNEIELINQFDGFDLEPRITVQLHGQPEGDLDELLTEETFRLERVGGGERVPLGRFVLDPDTRMLYALPDRLLAEGAEYRIVYAGAPTDVTFTTMTATHTLAQMRAQLDDGTAYDDAGIPPEDRGLRFTELEDGSRAVFLAQDVSGVTYHSQRTTDCEDVSFETGLHVDAPRTGARYFAFGSFLSPSWLDDDATIPQPVTGTGEPQVTGFEQVGVTLIVPDGVPPEGGWPVAIFGHGGFLTQISVFSVADYNAAHGIATITATAAGHGFGPCSQIGVDLASETATNPQDYVQHQLDHLQSEECDENPNPNDCVGQHLASVQFDAFGRGSDLNGDGQITFWEGYLAPREPHPKASIDWRDGHRQTAADIMALVRAITRGVDVDGDGTTDLSTSDINYYGVSQGGQYGTLATAVDPTLETSVLNVPGGPLFETARLSPWARGQLDDHPDFAEAESASEKLAARQPCLLNGGVEGFDESMPLRLDPAVTDPVEGAIAIQEAISRIHWIGRPGDPTAYTPLLRERPLPDVGPRTFLYQFAKGDRTAVNPSSAHLVRAGDIADRVALYRPYVSVLSEGQGSFPNPHVFLGDPGFPGSHQGQLQIVHFILSDGEITYDPDGPAPTWEFPLQDVDELETLNFPESLYSEPEPAPGGCGT